MSFLTRLTTTVRIILLPTVSDFSFGICRFLNFKDEVIQLLDYLIKIVFFYLLQIQANTSATFTEQLQMIFSSTFHVSPWIYSLPLFDINDFFLLSHVQIAFHELLNAEILTQRSRFNRRSSKQGNKANKCFDLITFLIQSAKKVFEHLRQYLRYFSDLSANFYHFMLVIKNIKPKDHDLPKIHFMKLHLI